MSVLGAVSNGIGSAVSTVANAASYSGSAVSNIGRNACEIGECYKEISEIEKDNVKLKEGDMIKFTYREGKVLGFGGKTNFNADYTNVEAKFTKYSNVLGVGDTIEVDKTSVKIDGTLVPNTYSFFYLDRIVKNTLSVIVEETLIGDVENEGMNLVQGVGNLLKTNTKQQSRESRDTEVLLGTLKSSWKDKVSTLIPDVDVGDIAKNEDITKMNEMLDSAASYISPFIQYEQIIKSLGISGQKIPIEFLEELSKIVNRFGGDAIPAIKRVNTGGTLYKNLSEMAKYFDDYKAPLGLTVINDKTMKWEGVKTDVKTDVKKDVKTDVKTDDKTDVKKGMFIGMFKSTFGAYVYYPVVLSSKGNFLISKQMTTGYVNTINASKFLCPNSFENGILLFTFNRSTCGNKDTRKSKSIIGMTSGMTSGVASGISGVASGISGFASRVAKIGTASPVTKPVTAKKGGKKRLTNKMRKQKK